MGYFKAEGGKGFMQAYIVSFPLTKTVFILRICSYNIIVWTLLHPQEIKKSKIKHKLYKIS